MRNTGRSKLFRFAKAVSGSSAYLHYHTIVDEFRENRKKEKGVWGDDN